MNPEIFAEWMRRQGHKIIRTSSSYWYEAGPRVLQAFPYHWLLEPSKKEIQDLLLSRGIACLRYSTPLEVSGGKISYHIVLRPPYHFDLLKSQSRNGVKRGLEHFKIEQISFDRLAREGWILQQDTLDRQNRLKSMTQFEWERICHSANDLPGFEAWAAIKNDELAAAVIVCLIDDTWNVPYALSHRQFLAEHVNNALFYSVSCDLLARENVNGIFFTLQSLDAPPTVDDFKLRMSLIAQPIRQRVDFNPFLIPFSTASVHWLLRGMLKKNQDNPILAKAEGMLRFHLEGKLPIRQQSWPECLMPQRETIMNSIGKGQNE